MRIAKIEAIRIPEPVWTNPQWWSTSPMDALYEAGDRTLVGAMGLFNKPISTTGADAFAVIVRATAEDGRTGLGVVGLAPKRSPALSKPGWHRWSSAAAYST